MKTVKICLYYYKALLINDKDLIANLLREFIIANYDKTDDLNLSDLENDASDASGELTVEDEELLIEEYDRTDTVAEGDADDEEYEDEETSDGIKTKFMSLISGKSKKKNDDDDDDIEIVEDEDEYEEEEDDEEESNSLVDKLPFLSAILNKNKKSDIEDDAEESKGSRGPKNKSKKKKKFELKIFHVVLIVGGLVAALYSEDDEVVTVGKDAKQIKVPVKPKTVEKKPIDETPVAITEPEPVMDEPVIAEPIIDEPVIAEPIIDEPAVADPIIDEPVIAEPVIAEPVIAEPVIAEPVIDEPVIDEPIIATPVISPRETGDSQSDLAVGNDGMGQGVKTQQIDDSVSDQTSASPDRMTEITKKLLGDLEQRLKAEKKEQKLVQVLKPVSAPSFEVRGPSLVYNCSGQHWACVDPKSFTECRQNYSWNTKNSLPIECYPFVDMSDNFDCATVQQEKIDNIGDTSFCR